MRFQRKVEFPERDGQMLSALEFIEHLPPGISADRENLAIRNESGYVCIFNPCGGFSEMGNTGYVCIGIGTQGAATVDPSDQVGYTWEILPKGTQIIATWEAS